MRLLIVRHGATANNAQARYTGQSDAGLSALGTAQAEALARRLAGERLDAIVSSDLARARATAEAIVARHPDVPPRLDADLREVALGAWEGHTPAEAAALYPEAYARWQADAVEVAPPGGETVRAFQGRVVRALDRWRAEYPHGSVLWVTHGGVLGVLLCHLLGMDLARRGQFRRDNAALTELELRAEGYAILMRLNDTGHLAGLSGGELAERAQVL
jgi:broad specificity phosphatase PhoE